MAINLAEKYSKKIVDKFYEDSVILGKTSTEYDWDGVKSIKVWTITTVAPTDYARSSAIGVGGVASRYGATTEVEDTIQTMTVTQDKAVSLSVDKGNNTQQMLIKNAGVVMARELREQFVPMFDKYALARWSGQLASTTTAPWYNKIQVKKDGSSALTKSNIVEKIFDGVTAIRNAETDVNDAYCYIGETLFAQLLQSTEFLDVDKLAERNLENGVMGKVRGVKIVPVPDSYLLKTTYDASSNVTALNNPNLTEDVNFMVVKKSVVLTPTKIKDAKVHQDPPGISGALLEVRWLYDAFVLNTKAKGIYVSLKKAA